jgi:GH24 family phage-related lysozyme (muramidase)
MDKKMFWWIAGSAAVCLIIMSAGYVSILKAFLVKWEGFSSTPYWDHKQWSWGYGTKVPGSVNDQNKRPAGTISRTEAMRDLLDHSNRDYLYLKPFIRINFTSEQWAALLSFAYNLGTGNADNLVPNINNRDWIALGAQWKQYVYSSGQVNEALVRRRAAEWELFKKGLS